MFAPKLCTFRRQSNLPMNAAHKNSLFSVDTGVLAKYPSSSAAVASAKKVSTFSWSRKGRSNCAFILFRSTDVVHSLVTFSEISWFSAKALIFSDFRLRLFAGRIRESNFTFLENFARFSDIVII